MAITYFNRWSSFKCKDYIVGIKELNKYINSGGIPIITGFQGVSNDFRITTIGRSGSDATAIMIKIY